MSKSWLQKYSTYEEEIHGLVTGITANPAGGQAAATQLTGKFNRVDTVAVANASVKLPAARVGKKCYIIHNVAGSYLPIAVYPQSGEYIDGYLDALAPPFTIYSQTAKVTHDRVMVYECMRDGYWLSYPMQNAITVHEKLLVTQAQIQNSFTAYVELVKPLFGHMIDPVSILRSSTNGGYSGNTTGVITSDSAGVEQEHTAFDYDAPAHSGYKKCIPNANGAFNSNNLGLYFRTKVGNPTGAGGDLLFHITYNIFIA